MSRELHKRIEPSNEFLEDDERDRVMRLLPKLLNTPLVVYVQPNVQLERVHDDHEGTYAGRLQVIMGSDGDMHIRTTNTHSGSGFLRFRTIGGGSKSDRVHNALRLLAEAIRQDNEARPITYPSKKSSECICPKECDCQNPPPDDWDGKTGSYHVSEMCPIHNKDPSPAYNCPVHP